jgi:hypothetical protein
LQIFIMQKYPNSFLSFYLDMWSSIVSNKEIGNFFIFYVNSTNFSIFLFNFTKTLISKNEKKN